MHENLELWIHHSSNAACAGWVVECGAEVTHVILPEFVVQSVIVLRKELLRKPNLRARGEDI
jgi:hypothetical protein